MYAQTNYPNTKLGAKGPDSIATAGCFVTAFSNLMQKFGVSVDPPHMNASLVKHAGFVDEEIAGWGAITKVYPNVRVARTGAGWPNSANAIVEFRYISQRTGNRITHFCAMASASAKTIIDSWDGKVKKSPYGTPVAYAIYGDYKPVKITPIKTKLPPAPKAKFVKVVKGNTLGGIAKANHLTLAQIAHLNPQIHNLNLIFPGQQIRVK